MLTKIIKKIIGIFGYKIISKNYVKNGRLVSKHSYLNLETLLANLFLKNKIKFLVQIGANDGIIFDSLNKFIKKFKPNSLLVEPIKENFDQLKKNYEDCDCIKFENSAISVNDEISFLYRVKTSKISFYDTHILGITSFNKNHLIQHGVKNSHIVKENVQSISIKELLTKYLITDIDLFFIDAEGYDCKIVYDFFNNYLLRPIVIFEYIHSDHNCLVKLTNKLSDINYIYFSINENLICFPFEKKQLLDFG
tara:strand:+ start:890 stop:1642 length:753 start_codon:yes stop_codon:yes gene_type:complete